MDTSLSEEDSLVNRQIGHAHLLCQPLANFTLDAVTARLPLPDQTYISTIRHPGSALRSAVARLLAQKLCQQLSLLYPGVTHQTGGRPELISGNAHLSLTHTTEWAGAALSLQGPIGFDLEQHAEKAQRIAPRFLKVEEVAYIQANKVPASLAFCLKEAAYKCESITGLSVRDDLTLIAITPRTATVICHHGKALTSNHTLNWFQLGNTYAALG